MRGSGSQFDPKVVKAFMDVLSEEAKEKENIRSEQ
jgi:HD-GYP domain-containing protein (c-di-GMP phosphodiesterase class II)